MNLKATFEKYNLPAKGVIHVGGTGEEAALYAEMGFKRVLFIQEDRSKMQALATTLKGWPHMLGVNVALAPENGYIWLGGVLTPARRLDTLLIEMAVHPREFNVLAGHSQKGIGAQASAKYWDVVEDRYMQTPCLNLWQRAHGRFGNQIFQYFIARLLAEQYNLQLRTWTWQGQSLFGLNEPMCAEELPIWGSDKEEIAASLQDHHVGTSPVVKLLEGSKSVPPLANRCFEGATQFHTSVYIEKDREAFRQIFRPVPALEEALQAGLARMMGDRKTLVAIHLRRGDYLKYQGSNMFWTTPAESYKPWLKEIWPLLYNPLLYVASDDPKAADEFAEYGAKRDVDLGVNIPEMFYPDFWVMTQAHALAISNSSFSFAAAMMNKIVLDSSTGDPYDCRNCCVRPLRDGTIQPFDPWNDEVLLGRDDPNFHIEPLSLVDSIPTLAAPQVVQAFPSTEETCSAILAELLPQIDPERKGAFVEVGLGTFAWDFVKMAELGFKCLVVEPMPVEPLRVACHQAKARLAEAVLSDQDGPVDLHIGTDPNLFSLRADWWGVQGGKTKMVPSYSLPVFMVHAETPIVTCLKLDVEGAEWDIIKTFVGLQPQLLPRVIMAEFGGTPRADGKGGWEREAISRTLQSLALLRSLGYNKLVVVEDHAAPVAFDLQTVSLDPAVLFPAGKDYGNYIAMRE